MKIDTGLAHDVFRRGAPLTLLPQLVAVISATETPVKRRPDGLAGLVALVRQCRPPVNPRRGLCSGRSPIGDVRGRSILRSW
jgi:hypothetical protein